VSARQHRTQRLSVLKIYKVANMALTPNPYKRPYNPKEIVNFPENLN